MTFSSLIPIFITIFIAELGDKTQLATVLFSSEENIHPLHVFLAASAALMLSTAVAVGFGHYGAALLQDIPLKLIAGIGFVVIGLFTIYEYFYA